MSKPELPCRGSEVRFVNLYLLGAGNLDGLRSIGLEPLKPGGAGLRVVFPVIDDRFDLEELLRSVNDFGKPRWIRFREYVLRYEDGISESLFVECDVPLANCLQGQTGARLERLVTLFKKATIRGNFLRPFHPNLTKCSMAPMDIAASSGLVWNEVGPILESNFHARVV